MSAGTSMMARRSVSALAMAAMLSLSVWFMAEGAAQQASKLRSPEFQVDPAWPIVPNNWVLGEVTSIAVDSHDRIWVLHRPRSIPADKRARPRPPCSNSMPRASC